MKKLLKHLSVYFVLVVFLLATNGMSIAVHCCSSHDEKYVGFFQADPECHDNDEIHHNSCGCDRDCCKTSEPCSSENIFLKLLADIMLSDNNSGCASLLGFFVVSNPVQLVFHDYSKINNSIFTQHLVFNDVGRVVLSKISQFIL